MENKFFVNLQVKIADLLPPGMYDALYGLKILPGYLTWKLHPEGYQRVRAVLGPLKDRYQGSRCVIIGNGPSLNQMDLSLLEFEYTFGLNRIYLLYEQWGFPTTFLVCVNRFVIHQFYHEIIGADSTKIINWRYRKPDQAVDTKTAFLPPSPFSRDMDGDILNGYYPHIGSVTNLAIELAYFMGFSEAILIGVDHSYREKGLGSKAVVSDGTDPNHFSPEYFGKGVTWQLPDYLLMEEAYRKNRNLFENDQRVIVDATKDGQLQVFRKVNFSEHLQNSAYSNKPG